MTVPGDPVGLRILVIDDDADTRANLRDILELDGYSVDDAGTAAEALKMPDWHTYFAVILDRRLPDGTAEGLLPKLKHLGPQAAVIIVTGYADLEGAIAAVRQGAADYLLKPVSPDVLRARLASLADRKRAESEIARLTSDMRTLLDVLPVGIAIAEDPDAKCIRINSALAGLLQLPHDPNAWLSLPPEEVPTLPLRRAAQGVEVKGTELELIRSASEVVTFYVYAAPLLDERGAPRGAVGAFLDVTERKRSQERLLQTERLAAIGQMVTGLAHESGNALARSQSCLEMLAWEVEDRPEAIDLIQRIQKAQDHLKQLYDEVRSYAAPLKLEREPWLLSNVWRQTWEHLTVLRQQRQVHLREETNNLDLTCAIDPFRLDQVFRNIFENALAACADPVEIVVHCREVLLDGQHAVCVSIQDNGPGLNAEQRRRIFDPFFTTKTKGTGLGMAIAKRIVEAHGGQIATGPAVGGGAELTITLPRNVS
jgi:signal transduction histidine kinase